MEVPVRDLVGVEEPAGAPLPNGVRPGCQDAYRVQLADSAEIVRGQRPLSRVRRHCGKHHRSRHIGMLQTEDVAQLVQPHGFDIEAVRYCAHSPQVLGVVKVNGLRQGVGDYTTGGREIGVRKDATDHRMIRILGRAPVDGDVWTLACPGLGEGEWNCGRPRGKSVAHRRELGATADVVRPVLEREGEVGVWPCAAGGERDAVVEIWQSAPVRRHLVAGPVVEHSGLRQPVILLVARQSLCCWVV